MVLFLRVMLHPSRAGVMAEVAGLDIEERAAAVLVAVVEVPDGAHVYVPLPGKIADDALEVPGSMPPAVTDTPS